jgi:hypothetical protein
MVLYAGWYMVLGGGGGAEYAINIMYISAWDLFYSLGSGRFM